MENRYRLYREHKYIFYVFCDLLQLIAKLDFRIKSSFEKFKMKLRELEQLLQAHAHFEEERIHQLLETKGSLIFSEAEKHHQEHDIFFQKLNEKLAFIEEAQNYEVERLSYEIYLDLRNFFSETLGHFDYEERVIMPELQRLATDDEIREIDRITYRQMVPEEMVGMMEVLFPHMNTEDKFHFLQDIRDCEPHKFDVAWNGIHSVIEQTEREALARMLNLKG